MNPLQYNPNTEIFEKDENGLNEYLFIKFNENQEKLKKLLITSTKAFLLMYENDIDSKKIYLTQLL